MAPDDPTVRTLHVDANRWFAVGTDPRAVVLCIRRGDQVDIVSELGVEFTEALVDLLLERGGSAGPAWADGPPGPAWGNVPMGPDRVSIRISVTALDAKWLVAAAKASSAIEDDTNVPMAKVVERLAHHAADGARRPGAWERGWLNQVLGLDGDPVELVDCEHDWSQGDRLRQCSKCFAYSYGGE